MNDIGVITLSNGGFTIVDADLFPELNRFRWWKTGKEHGYVQRRVFHRHEYLHRRVLNCPEDKFVDHINGHRIDNRRRNLRVVSLTQSSYNKGKESGCTSKYKGVSWSPQRGRWRVTISHNRKFYHLGFFESEKTAAKAYNKKALELFGEYSRLNTFD